MLVVQRCYVKTHITDIPTSKFKPHCFITEVAIKVVLFGVTFEKVSLSKEVVVRIGLSVFVIKICILSYLLG